MHNGYSYAQQTLNIATTSLQRRDNVVTLCVYWERLRMQKGSVFAAKYSVYLLLWHNYVSFVF